MHSVCTPIKPFNFLTHYHLPVMAAGSRGVCSARYYSGANHHQLRDLQNRSVIHVAACFGHSCRVQIFHFTQKIFGRRSASDIVGAKNEI